MTEVTTPTPTLDQVQAENARLRAELEAYRRAMREFADLAREAAHYAGAAAAMATLASMDDTEGLDPEGTDGR